MSEKKLITVVCLHSIFDYPPVISLVKCLLDLGYKVNLISYNVEKLERCVLDNPNFSYRTKEYYWKPGIADKVKKTILNTKFGKKEIKPAIEDSDLIWIATDATLRYLGKTVKGSKYVLQLMELLERYYIVSKKVKLEFPISEYAKNAWKIVVPEINRAYIQKAWWNLDKTPIVLPNKPYINTLPDEKELPEEIKEKLEIIKSEKRKVILYLGVVGKDRELENYAEAVSMLGEDYCFYIIGRPAYEGAEKIIESITRRFNNAVYLGYFNSPNHLPFIKYAHIGLLPYKVTIASRNISILNALYCAPNKIYEYAMYGVPMVGSDVLGLIHPFEKYGIGVCADDSNPDDIKQAIKMVDNSHNKMASNCSAFLCETDYKQIVNDIISDIQ